MTAPAVFQEPPPSEANPAGAVRIIRDDAEALRAVAEIAERVREGAIARDRDRILPQEEIEALSRAGFYGITVPKRHGGPEVSAATLSEAFRILSAADPSVGQMPQNHFCWAPIFETGTAEQEAFFYGRLLKGDRIGNAHSENTRKRPKDYEAKVERVEGGYVVTGKKYYSTGAIFAQWIPTIATDEKGDGIMLFASRETPGFTFINDWTGMGQRTTASGTTIFDKVFVPDFHVFPFGPRKDKDASGGQPPGTSARWGSVASLIHAAVDLGIAEEAYADAKDYILTKNRPWIENPFEEHSKEPFVVRAFGELTTELRTARLLQRAAAEAIDAYRANPNPETHLESRLAVADARIACGKASLHIADQLFALTGARATLEEYRLDRHWRNARTHTLHDPFRWKEFHIGNYFLNGVTPPAGSYI